MDIIPLVFRNLRAYQNRFYLREKTDNFAVMWETSGANYAETLDKYLISWWIAYASKVAPLQKRLLIDLRDEAIFYDLYRNCPGQNIVAVVNQLHTLGVEAHWRHTTGTEVPQEFINPIGDFDINEHMEGTLIQGALRNYTSKNAKSEPTDWDGYLTMYHKKTMEQERTRHVYFLGHDDPHMNHH
mmetsp:Transcript_22714/g.19736  ORF Transcript_22714/g.19736 Transcript_22714/m.19736 type:complete len:185 (+) Transcript_22714:606-1160(+)